MHKKQSSAYTHKNNKSSFIDLYFDWVLTEPWKVEILKSFSSTLYHLQNVYEEEICCLFTVMFEKKLDYLIRNNR